jgi:hypothetical protein
MAIVTLYRADQAELYQGAGSCWAESHNDAQRYTDNPGFGGPIVHEMTHDVDADRVLDVTGDNAVAQLASALGLDRQDLLDLGGMVYHCWENSSRIRNLICERYDWVKYTDDFPACCTTWCRMAE